jgi:hypothetical protein
MNLEGKRFAYTIVEESRASNGGYIPCIAVENEPGYSPMTGQGAGAAPWNWGKDRALAQRLCDERNERMGISKEDAFRIVGSSMFAKV